MSDFEMIRSEREGDILTITLDRPERLNACPPDMADEAKGIVPGTPLFLAMSKNEAAASKLRAERVAREHGWRASHDEVELPPEQRARRLPAGVVRALAAPLDVERVEEGKAGDVDGDGVTSVNVILQLLRDFTE